MKSKREVSFLVLLLGAALFAQDASAIPVGGVLDDSHSEMFIIEDGFAIVDCKVYSYPSGEYVYTYQISNDSAVGLSFFSVGILPGADAFAPHYDSDSGVVIPALWDAVNSPVQSVDGLFTDTVDDDGISSAILWFKSNYPSTSGSGVLFGTLSGIPHCVTGDLLTPIPEPATIFLLGIGGALITLTRKRRFL